MLDKNQMAAVEEAMDRLRGRDVTFDFRPDGSVWAVSTGPDGATSVEAIVTTEVTH